MTFAERVDALNGENRKKYDTFEDESNLEGKLELLFLELVEFRQYVEDMNRKMGEMASPDNLMKMAEKFLAPGPGGF